MGIQSCMDNSKSNVKLSICLLTFNHENIYENVWTVF